MRLPGAVLDEYDRTWRRAGVPSRSEAIRRLVEREIGVSDRLALQSTLHSRRLRRLRRCVSCTAFVRNGYTCKTCRLTPADSIVLDGVVVPSPVVPRHPLPVRPDLRDPRWSEAEAIVLDAYAPIVAILYEHITGEDSHEMTDLDDIADLLAMAASIAH